MLWGMSALLTADNLLALATLTLMEVVLGIDMRYRKNRKPVTLHHRFEGEPG